MTQAAISELKALLSEYISRVRKGEEVLVTDRGHPVAKLIPFRAGGAASAQRKELARQGILELGSGRISHEFFKPSPVKDPTGVAVKELLEERKER